MTRNGRRTASPLHRAVWDDAYPVAEFDSADSDPPADVRAVMDASLAVVRRHRDAGTLLDEHRKIRNEVLAELADAGYWGLLVPRAYGGTEAQFRHFAQFLTTMATVDPTIAGLASVHGCIGAVDPVVTFGTEDQRQRFLPKLASGERLSAFALTEPAAGSDLTALKTHAIQHGDHYLLTGEKLFITNADYGRTVGVVCLIDKKPVVLIVDLPSQETDTFQFKHYTLHALKHTWNRGLIFKNFVVPVANRLDPPTGGGLLIAYHGLNRGRVSLCANAAGTMRMMLASLNPWVAFRRTYGEPIAARELVRRRMAKLAGLIVGCDAMVSWCAGMLDDGYRGEMECIIAKIFGSEAQKEAAIEIVMKTHGGRSFLSGHLFGDNVHEYLAPCIYEGEGEMLGMALFKSLVKQHGTKYFEPVGRRLAEVGIKRLNPMNPTHAWALRREAMPYAMWLLRQKLLPWSRIAIPSLPPPLDTHARFAADGLRRMRLEIDDAMRSHQLKLADRQCRMLTLSSRVQDLTVILVTALYAGRKDDEIITGAADILCTDLVRKITGHPATDRQFRTMTDLGHRIATDGFPGLDQVQAAPILMPYTADR